MKPTTFDVWKKADLLDGQTEGGLEAGELLGEGREEGQQPQYLQVLLVRRQTPELVKPHRDLNIVRILFHYSSVMMIPTLQPPV